MKALKSRQLTIFAPYLLFLFIQETLVFFYRLSHPKGSTAIVYNIIYRPITVGTFAFFYYSIYFNKPARKIILGMVGVYLATTLINFTFIQSIRDYNSYLSLVGGLVITSCGIFFLFNYFNLDDRAEEKKWIPVIWITAGIISYYPVVNISFSFYHQLLNSKAKLGGSMLYNAIPQFMSIFMYGCFAYAFYLCRKKT
jgi:hypothetical protein